MHTRTIILASGSPRRQQFLRALGLAFAIQTADIDETPRPREAPLTLVRRLAESKARVVAASLPPGSHTQLIIAADTVGALDDTLLGKPTDPADAQRMLAELRNRTHQVHSAVSVLQRAPDTPDVQRTAINTTNVLMRNYSDAEIAKYVASGDPLDKAAAYAIQNADFAPVRAIDGCLSNVIGLPLADLRDLLADFGVAITQPLPTLCEAHADFACCQRPANGSGQK